MASPLALAWLLSACAHDYRPPGHNEPHAQVKVRLAYHAWPGQALEQAVAINGDELRELAAPKPQGVAGVTTGQVLVRPGLVGCSVRATFFHNEITTHAETYETTEDSPCGASTCKQSRPHTRLVNKVDRVEDATCSQGLRFPAKSGESYVLEYDFQADQQCTLTCHRLGKKAKSGAGNLPCEEPAGALKKR